MSGSGAEGRRPFRHFSIEEMERQIREVRQLSDLKALRTELTHRKTKRAAQLDDLIARVIREWTGSYDPKAGDG